MTTMSTRRLSRQFRAAITLMEANGAEIVQIPMPWVKHGRKINMGVVMPEAVSVHRKNISEHPDTYPDEIRARLQSAMTIAAVDYVQAQRTRRWFIEKMNEAMQVVDVLLTPTVPERTPTIARAETPPRRKHRPAGRQPGELHRRVQLDRAAVAVRAVRVHVRWAADRPDNHRPALRRGHGVASGRCL